MWPATACRRDQYRNRGYQRSISDIWSCFFDGCYDEPPYMTDTHGLKNPDLPKAIARHEVMCTLDDVVREGARVLKPGGRFYMVNRPFQTG